jgi:hypothetical protein
MNQEKIERMKLVAKEFNLLSVDFFGEDGKPVRDTGQFKGNYVSVCFGFSNGEEIMLTREEAHEFDNFKFTLSTGERLKQ